MPEPASTPQARAVLDTAPVQGDIRDVADILNACATLWLPTEIFEFDIGPSTAGPTKFSTGGPDVLLAPAHKGTKTPVCDNLCDEYGTFTALRPVTGYDQPLPCPGRGKAAPSAILTVPACDSMDGVRRTAFTTNLAECGNNMERAVHTVPDACLDAPCRLTMAARVFHAAPLDDRSLAVSALVGQAAAGIGTTAEQCAGVARYQSRIQSSMPWQAQRSWGSRECRRLDRARRPQPEFR